MGTGYKKIIHINKTTRKLVHGKSQSNKHTFRQPKFSQMSIKCRMNKNKTVVQNWFSFGALIILGLSLTYTILKNIKPPTLKKSTNI